ncbi:MULTISPECIES: NAD-dependent epimerase/dehydratase family protein [unclassified Paracoccus (in: a-proteobacteria)]|uniref:NAD-dependent epimerase/dehydratase family protein n=1 Tax=unclassified Paracoccus (in: a-proteobacteria) TaxID=2688777 RepID=UPI0021E1094A|nr:MULTISPECIES: NAD(P)-dependent oxidoreductase [unclassified Paracoccus (in: a-proteobacteria)]UXU75750.1 NAD(P)-dependent oxidoreductase [Paracoccus sp. SMMA_5]UXU81657.1 NAD(P)-dependent oxidoreductase [Paracoccus sp. SMMA_5_TC]
MLIALTGASGIVGGWIGAALTRAGHQLRPLHGWRLGQPADLAGCQALVHAAFQHLPGRYRGGEGDDPAGFRRANLDGTLALFRDAQAQGVGRVLFVSSRAVHDGHPPGTLLTEDMPPAPTTLYGEVKAQAEQLLAAMAGPDFRTASLRPTGVFGPGRPQKWAGLIGDFLAGRPIAPRVATEVHGADLADAALLVLSDPAMSGAYDVSDLILDRHDLLAAVAALTGARHPPPPRADARLLRVPKCARLRALGWQPRGLERLHADLPLILEQLKD